MPWKKLTSHDIVIWADDMSSYGWIFSVVPAFPLCSQDGNNWALTVWIHLGSQNNEERVSLHLLIWKMDFGVKSTVTAIKKLQNIQY